MASTVSQDLIRSSLVVSLVLASLVPATLTAAALVVSRRSPFGVASGVTFLTAGLSVLAVTLHALGSRAASLAGDSDVPSMLRGVVQLDVPSSAMLVLVCTLAIVVVRYSRTYLAAEGGLVRYSRSLLLTLASVTLLVLSNHLGLLVAAWLGAGIGLHQLLVFYRKRRQAVIVAHKKFLLARIADMFLFASLALVDAEVGSLHIDVLNAHARASETLSPSLHLATVLLVFGVLLKTAQLPFHGWILQVMEAPTPVSALLHAGVVNIGGFVMIRLAPLMTRASYAQALLLGVGLVTAMVGSLVMTTRPSIKVVLAWSTIAQMGFMLVQCGLGVWNLALLHLLAHSLYKAHAFLSAGNVVTTWRSASLVRPSPLTLQLVAAAALVVCALAAPFYAAFRFSELHASESLAPLALALGASFVPTIARALASGRRTFALAALFSLGAAASYFVWHSVFETLAPSSTDAGAESPLGWSIVVAGLVVLFVAQTTLHTSPNGRLARTLQPLLHSGLYIDDWFTRMTFRLWPPRLERPNATSRRSSITLEPR
jgi:NAD(P)H-quinone oxidoreductase subunit 5